MAQETFFENYFSSPRWPLILSLNVEKIKFNQIKYSANKTQWKKEIRGSLFFSFFLRKSGYGVAGALC